MSAWYQGLLNKTFSQLDLQQKASLINDDPSFYFKPFVTFSRDPGSGGKPIAELFAKEMGFEFYDDLLLEEIAKSAKARKEAMAKVDEKRRGFMEDIVHNVLNPEYISERRYITHLCKVVLTVAHEGNVVFLGRGANFIAPNAFGLHVRITAPYRVCVSRAVQYEKVPHRKARQIIKKVTTERAEFVKQYFGKDISNPKYYDLVLNTTFMSLEDAVELIKHAFRLKFPGQ